mmetsp:Transcript_13561/g.43382  ORF Transcript_13561/g.43382 Transcript_13561/m.43382 type:complete len:267 (-) Transcript_13561:53-853(-)
MDARRGRKYPGGHPRARHAVVPHRPEAGAPHARRRAKPVAPPPAVGGGVSRRNHGARQRGAASRRARPSHNASAAAAAGACSRRRPDRHRGGVAQSDGGHTCPCRGAVDAHHRRGAWPLPLDDAGGRDHRGGSQAARPGVARDRGGPNYAYLVRIGEFTGLKWRKIAAMLPNRSDSSIRNRWMRLQEERAREAGESGATPRAGAMRALAAKEDSCTSTTGPPPPTALLAARVVDNGKADVQAAPAGSTELIVAALQDRRRGPRRRG